MDAASRILDTVRSALASRGAPFFAAAAGVLFCLPSLWAGFYLDDNYHRLVMQGFPGKPELFSCPVNSLFTFFSGDPERTRLLMDIGFFPWWTMEDRLLSFWRPLAAITHWLDYRLWPGAPFLMHLHSIAWYGLAVAAAGLFYRRIMGGAWAAGLAALMFALDDAHGFPVGWLANRNELPALLFSVLALVAHHRWRTRGQRAWGALAPLLLFAGLLFKESAVATLGYLAAYGLFMDPAGKARGLMAAAPAVMSAAVWRIIYMALGYGVREVPTYIDPLSRPLDFLSAALSRAPVLILDQLIAPASEVVSLVRRPGHDLKLAVALVFIALFALLCGPLFRRDRRARFFGLGALLSVLPACAVYPSDRMLFFTGIGGMGLAALFIESWGRLFSRGPARLAARVMGFLLAAAHLAISPLLLPVGAYTPALAGRDGERAGRIAHGVPDVPGLEQKRVYIVNRGPDIAGLVLNYRALNDMPLPRSLRGLGGDASDAVLIERVGGRSLLWSSDEGAYGKSPRRQVYRDLDHPLSRGERVELPGMTAEVKALTGDGRPSRVLFTFEHGLSDESLIWLKWDWEGGGLSRFDLPAAGAKARLKRR